MEVGTIWGAAGGFFATMTNDEMQKLRCEDSINSIVYNSTVGTS